MHHVGAPVHIAPPLCGNQRAPRSLCVNAQLLLLRRTDTVPLGCAESHGSEDPCPPHPPVCIATCHSSPLTCPHTAYMMLREVCHLMAAVPFYASYTREAVTHVFPHCIPVPLDWIADLHLLAISYRCTFCRRHFSTRFTKRCHSDRVRVKG